MTRDELLKKLRAYKAMWGREQYDSEQIHIDRDQALLEYVNDPEIAAAFNDVPELWYA